MVFTQEVEQLKTTPNLTGEDIGSSGDVYENLTYLSKLADVPAPYELMIRAENLDSACLLVAQLQTIKDFLEYSFDGVKNLGEFAPLFEFSVFNSAIVHFVDRVSDYWLVIIQADAVILLIQALEDFLEQNDEFRETWLKGVFETPETSTTSSELVEENQVGEPESKKKVKKKINQLEIDSYWVTPPAEMRSIPQETLKMALKILYGSKQAGRIDGWLKSGWMYEGQNKELTLSPEMSKYVFEVEDAEKLARDRIKVAGLKQRFRVREHSLRQLRVAISFVHQVGWDSLPIGSVHQVDQDLRPYLNGVVGRP